MKKPEATKPGPSPAAGLSKRPYHAPKLRVHGTLTKLTSKGSAGGDLGAKKLP